MGLSWKAYIDISLMHQTIYNHMSSLLSLSLLALRP